MTTKSKVITWIVAILILALAGFVYFKFCFVYATSDNTGTINYFKKEGFIFKTYEGKMIQSGTQAGMKSYEFKFSVEDENVAQQIRDNANKEMTLITKQYLGVLPWRGDSRYVVDSIVVR
ncbi:MAG: hypothetical protein MJZ65_03485 [Paludibacteraceae bacterium]|nr:hypothetical protein [Paludibacteraceae bacterium]